MSKLTGRRSKKAGLSPGTLIYLGSKRTEEVKISLMEYDGDHVQERVLKKSEEAFPFKDLPTSTWVNIDGLQQVEIIEALGRHFNIHPLVLEDILSTGQRPKMEEFESYIYIVLRMLSFNEQEAKLEDEQVSLILGPNFVLTFQENEGDVFDPVRNRLRNDKGKIRKAGADYLVYALIDAVVDNYFAVLEKVGDRIEFLDEQLAVNPTPEVLAQIHDLKRSILFLRKAVWPLRDVINHFQRGEIPIFQPPTMIFMRDVYDHTVQVIDTVETLRDIVAGMMDLYLSSLSNRMNEVMKVLTIIATIFIPLTFIVGIYGMNFDYIPELRWHWGYFAVLGIMGIIALGMLLYFKRKKWL
ncbi:magnesium/cobalt transporter CorA [Candidatus Acetothermia bacterium]|nr:magnesium/cobalt transporter CorA [Candidatus Acetothermia bacterium]MBI3643853.1 magnesium/cobalt transporter CorA [Candidatus Acetothermia bacterium]